MDHTPPECSLALKYLRGSCIIGALDRQTLFNDLLRGTSPREASAWAVRPVLSEYDHVVVAYSAETHKAIGFLGGRNCETLERPFLWLETGFVAEPARGQNLLRRMIAVMLIRSVSLDDAPVAIATMTCNPVAVHVIAQMASHLHDVRFAPAPEGAVVDLATIMLARDVSAALGRRFEYQHAHRLTTTGLDVVQAGRSGEYIPPVNIVAPMLAMLDLREASAHGLIADLRGLYRRRPHHATRHAGALSGLASRNPTGRVCKR